MLSISSSFVSFFFIRSRTSSSISSSSDASICCAIRLDRCAFLIRSHSDLFRAWRYSSFPMASRPNAMPLACRDFQEPHAFSFSRRSRTISSISSSSDSSISRFVSLFKNPSLHDRIRAHSSCCLLAFWTTASLPTPIYSVASTAYFSFSDSHCFAAYSFVMSSPSESTSTLLLLLTSLSLPVLAFSFALPYRAREADDEGRTSSTSSESVSSSP